MVGEYIKILDEVEEYFRSIGEYDKAAKINTVSWALYEYWQEIIRLTTTQDK